jgi:hypothetical protein
VVSWLVVGTNLLSFLETLPKPSKNLKIKTKKLKVITKCCKKT